MLLLRGISVAPESVISISYVPRKWDHQRMTGTESVRTQARQCGSRRHGAEKKGFAKSGKKGSSFLSALLVGLGDRCAL
jgi:hypothetical protein